MTNKQEEPYQLFQPDLDYFLQFKHLKTCGLCFQDYAVETNIVCPRCDKDFYTAMFAPSQKGKVRLDTLPKGETFQKWVDKQDEKTKKAIYTNSYYYPKREPNYEKYDVQSIKDQDELSAFYLAMGNSKKKSAQEIKRDIKQQDRLNKMDIAADKQEQTA